MMSLHSYGRVFLIALSATLAAGLLAARPSGPLLPVLTLASPALATPADAPAPPAIPATAVVGGPTATRTPTLPPSGCPDTRGSMDLMQLTTHLQPWPIAMRIYMPPCYDADREAGYPLLILLHGQGYSFDQWERDGIVAAADRLITAGEIVPHIIVMPNEFDSLSDPAGSHYDQVITEAVLPWVEEHYRTCVERNCRAIGGISRGATWAVHIGFQRPDLFAAVGAHSFTPFIGDVYRLKYWLASPAPAGLPRFYLDMGAADQPPHLEAIDQFRQAMLNLGVSFEWHLNAGGYDDAYWSAQAEAYLRWYGGGWK